MADLCLLPAPPPVSLKFQCPFVPVVSCFTDQSLRALPWSNPPHLAICHCHSLQSDLSHGSVFRPQSLDKSVSQMSFLQTHWGDSVVSSPSFGQTLPLLFLTEPPLPFCRLLHLPCIDYPSVGMFLQLHSISFRRLSYLTLSMVYRYFVYRSVHQPLSDKAPLAVRCRQSRTAW